LLSAVARGVDRDKLAALPWRLVAYGWPVPSSDDAFDDDWPPAPAAPVLRQLFELKRGAVTARNGRRESTDD
jgi:hypothetical protein